MDGNTTIMTFDSIGQLQDGYENCAILADSPLSLWNGARSR